MVRYIKTGLSITCVLCAYVFWFSSCNRAGQSQRNLEKQQAYDSINVSRVVNELSDKIGLSLDKRDSLTLLFMEHFKELQSTIQKRQGREVMDQLKERFETKVESLLDEEQFIVFQTFMENARPRPQGPPQQGPPRR
jgi:hypothetical protein